MAVVGTEDAILRGYDWGVWCDTMDKLFGATPEVIADGVAEVARWRASVGVNVAIDATASLAEAKARDWVRETAKKAGEATAITKQEVVTLYSMGIIRMVNGLTSEIETRRARSVRLMAAELGLPDELVDVRHAATHSALPSIHELRIAAALALDYLHAQYWQPQRDAMLAFHRRRRTAAAGGAAGGAAPDTPLSHLIHPYLGSARPSATTTQDIVRMETDCPDGIEAALARIEGELGITPPASNHTAAACTGGVWGVSAQPLATILAGKEGTPTCGDVAMV